ncbi:MAG: DNA primase [Pseudomonadota bacterium]
MAGRIPQNFINDLVARLDIVDVVESRMTLKKTGKNYSGLCPFHDEKTPSFSVSPDKQFFHCFGCQESGTALSFVMKFDRLDFVEAVEMLAAQLGLEVPREGGRGPTRASVDPDIFAVLGQAERFYRAQLRAHPEAIEYLKSRGLSGEVARDFGIGFAPDAWQALSEAYPQVTTKQWLDAGLMIKNDKGRTYDRFRQRVMFPIRDTRGRVIAFGGRSLGQEEGPKYLNSPETEVFHKGAELYGLYEARQALRRLESLIIVEGYMDVVALAQHGVANVVATLGTASGEAHFRKLFRYVDRVVCCFDGDQAGRSAAWKALENALGVLTEHKQISLVFLPDGEDPDTLVRKIGTVGFQAQIAAARPGLEYFFTHLSRGLDLEALDDRAKLAGLVRPYLERVQADVVRTLLEQRLAQLTGLQTPPTPAGGGYPTSEYRPPPSAPQPPSRRVDAAHQKLRQRLLLMFLQQPQNWAAIESRQRADTLASAAELGVLGEVLQVIDANPGADTEALLVYWSDSEHYEPLRRAALAHLDLGRDQWQQYCADGIGKILSFIREQNRKAAQAKLGDGSNIDELREYWRQRDD